MVQRVAPFSEPDGFLGEREGLLAVSAPRQKLRPDRAPRRLGGQVVGGRDRLGSAGPALCLVVAGLGVEDLGEVGGARRKVAVVAGLLEKLADLS